MREDSNITSVRNVSNCPSRRPGAATGSNQACDVFVSGAGPTEANPFAKRLYDDLLSNYNRLIRPVSNNTEKLTVWLKLKLSQLIDVVSSVANGNVDCRF